MPQPSVTTGAASGAKPLRFRRVLLKISGEALMGPGQYGIDNDTVKRIASEVKDAKELGVELSLVIGGGNIFRGMGAAAQGMERASADYMGMLATVMNALALQDALEKQGAFARTMSALKINEVCEDYIRRRAVRHLEKGRICIFAAGTGNPFFTTDSAAALRAVEIGAELLLKATKVDGVYDRDPQKHPDATRYERLSYDQVLQQDLKVMDTAAFALCRDYKIPLRVYNLSEPGSLMRILCGEAIGTLVSGAQ